MTNTGGARGEPPDLRAVRALVARIFPGVARPVMERVEEGVSTHVYRIGRGGVRFYLRVWPEPGEGFAPEARVHALLRERGVRVPEVVYFEHDNALLRRSVLVTTAVAGNPVGRRGIDRETRTILVAAGRDLAVINSGPVAGFGWLRRDRAAANGLAAEHPTYRAFIREHLEEDLALLAAAIRELLARHDAWIDVPPARLAHGDFDATHIYERDGRYTGIIDFGEIRGGDPWYDLGHFRMHDGETLPAPTLPWLLEGYGAVTPLQADHARRIGFSSLLIAVRALARRLRKARPAPQDWRRHQGLVAIARDLAVLTADPDRG